MPTEAEYEQSPESLDARELLERRLRRLAPDELDAFWQAVRRCYASSKDDDASEAAAI